MLISCVLSEELLCMLVCDPPAAVGIISICTSVYLHLRSQEIPSAFKTRKWRVLSVWVEPGNVEFTFKYMRACVSEDTLYKPFVLLHLMLKCEQREFWKKGSNMTPAVSDKPVCIHGSRYTAVAMPLLYNTRYSSRRRVAVMIAVVWFLSFAISCPLLFGLNNTGNSPPYTFTFELFFLLKLTSNIT